MVLKQEYGVPRDNNVVMSPKARQRIGNRPTLIYIIYIISYLIDTVKV